MRRSLAVAATVLGLFVASAGVAVAQVPWAVSGMAHLVWNFRGGQCSVQYKEAGTQDYHYQTVASCDDGGIFISGLVPGVSYVFQVSPDGGANWSRPLTIKAKSALGMINEDVNGAASVKLVWNMRGGACSVRYTEAGQHEYKYATWTNCDDGQVIIGALVPGRNYRFQIQQDSNGWSKPVTVLAR